MEGREDEGESEDLGGNEDLGGREDEWVSENVGGNEDGGGIAKGEGQEGKRKDSLDWSRG